MSGAAYEINFSALNVQGGPGVSAGSVCSPSGTGGWVLGTAANRAAAGCRGGIAITNPDLNNIFQIQFGGYVPNSVTRLGAGSATYVRSSAAGILERVTTPAATDEIWGKCDALGNLTIDMAAGVSNTVGNATITNLDTAFGHTPALVRYSMRPFTQPFAGANESSAFYWRYDATLGGTNAQYGLYLEVDPIQNYTTGGSATKVIHRGHGDAHFVALLNGISPATITAMTGNGVSPIVCTIPSHGFGQNDIVTISGCTGNTAANGTWFGITVIDSNTFSLPASTGNGTYNASSGQAQDIDPPVGYEGAQWGDGCTSFLASMQYPGGRANATGFNFLYQANALLNYGGFVGNEVPNNCFVVNKRIGMADSTLDGYSQFSLLDANIRMLGGNGVSSGNYRGGWSASTAYVLNDTVAILIGSNYHAYACILANTNQQPPNATYWTEVTDTPNFNRRRFAVFNSGEVDIVSLLANSSTTTYDSPILRQKGSYWNGSAGIERSAYLVHHMTSTTPSSDFRLYMGPVGSESVRLIVSDTSPVWYRTPLEGAQDAQTLQVYDLIAVLNTTNASAGTVDTAYKPPAGHGATVRILWNVVDTMNGHSAGAITLVVIRNVSGTLTVAGSTAVSSTVGDGAVNTSALTFSVSVSNTLKITGTPPGAYSGSLDWTFRCEIVEN